MYNAFSYITYPHPLSLRPFFLSPTFVSQYIYLYQNYFERYMSKCYVLNADDFALHLCFSFGDFPFDITFLLVPPSPLKFNRLLSIRRLQERNSHKRKRALSLSFSLAPSVDGNIYVYILPTIGNSSNISHRDNAQTLFSSSEFN